MNTILNQVDGEAFTAIHGDCVEAVRELPDNSVGFSIFSPPFSHLFIYSDSERDMGNAANDAEFLEHYRFLVRERDTWQPLQDDVLRGGAWREPLSALSFMQAGRAPQSGTVRVLFGREAIEPAITIRLARDDAQVDIVTTGPGRYVVQ